MSFRNFLSHLPDREGHMLVSYVSPSLLPTLTRRSHSPQLPSYTSLCLPCALLGYFLL